MDWFEPQIREKMSDPDLHVFTLNFLALKKPVRTYCPNVYTLPAFRWSWLATVLLLLLLLTALLSLEGVSLVDGLLPSEAGSEYMGGGGCRLKVKFVRKLIRFST